MSKRDVGASMTTYMEEGFTPEAVLNYLSLLGWSPKDDRQKMAIGEVISLFDLPQILRHNALWQLLRQYLSERDSQMLDIFFLGSNLFHLQVFLQAT